MRAFWFVILMGLLNGAVIAEQQVINGVAVIVNDTVITFQDVRLFVGPSMELLERQYENQPVLLRQKQLEMMADATDQLVERQLILNDFKSTGYNMPQSVIDDTIRDRIRQRYGDRVTLAKTLKAEGVTFETYRQRTREEIIIEQMRYVHVSKELIISPQQISDFYNANKTNFMVEDRVKLRMIMLNKPENDNGATRQVADEILANIKKGDSFEDLAKVYSEGSQRANGGDWGWADRKSGLRPELADIAFKLKKGQYSDVIDFKEGCFIMLVEDMQPAHVKPLADVRDEIEKNLLIKERNRLQKRWVDRMKTKSFIRYF